MEMQQAQGLTFTKQAKYFGEYKNAENWRSGDIPFDKPEICTHWMDIDVLPRQPYQRPHSLKTVSRVDHGDFVLTREDKIYSHPYEGEVDTILELSCSPDGMDSEGRGHIALLEGIVKAGILSNGLKRSPVSSNKDCKKILDQYFGFEGAGNRIIYLLFDSNLPYEVKERLKGLAPGHK